MYQQVIKSTSFDSRFDFLACFFPSIEVMAFWFLCFLLI